MSIYSTLKNGLYICLASTLISSGCATGPKLSPIQELSLKRTKVATRYTGNQAEYDVCKGLQKEFGKEVKGLEDVIKSDESLIQRMDKALETKDESAIEKLNRELQELQEKKKRNYTGLYIVGATILTGLLAWLGYNWYQGLQEDDEATPGGGEGPGGPGGQ